MRIVLGVLIAAALIPLPAVGAPDPLDAPPAGLASTTVKLSAVLAANATATGKLEVGQVDTTVENWTFVEAGKSGTEHLERSGADFYALIRKDPFVDEYGQFDAIRWHKDDNGFTSTMTNVDEAPFLPLRVLADLSDPKNDLSLAGTTSGDKPQYVIKCVPPQVKHPKWIFVDESTGLISRIDDVSGKRRRTHTFDDYRLDRGAREPWHIHDSDGRPALDADWQRTSVTHPSEIDPAHFAPPKSTPTVSLGLAQAAKLPARMFFGSFVVRLSVEGRGLDFVIDSGSDHSVIDRTVAQELHLPTFGQTTALSDGTAIGYRTILPDATVGQIRLEHFALTAVDYHYQPSPDVRVVGALGYDFLTSVVLHMSYENGTVEAIPQSAFNAADPVPGSFIIPFTVDDGMPLVSVGIGNAVASRMAIDTAFPYTMIFGGFVDENPSEFPDEHGKQRRVTSVPFADNESYGIEAEVWTSPVASVRFGPTNLHQFPMLATNFAGTRIDGMLCANYLKFYDLYFDYANDRLILHPNRLFNDTFKKIPL